MATEKVVVAWAPGAPGPRGPGPGLRAPAPGPGVRPRDGGGEGRGEAGSGEGRKGVPGPNSYSDICFLKTAVDNVGAMHYLSGLASRARACALEELISTWGKASI